MQSGLDSVTAVPAPVLCSRVKVGVSPVRGGVMFLGTTVALAGFSGFRYVYGGILYCRPPA